MKVEWSPFQSGVLASCGMDRRVIVWDLSLQGQGEIPNALVTRTGKWGIIFKG
jgi:hypothetical protein